MLLIFFHRGGDTDVASQLSSVDIETVLCTLIKALDQAGNDADNSMEEGTSHPPPSSIPPSLSLSLSLSPSLSHSFSLSVSLSLFPSIINCFLGMMFSPGTQMVLIINTRPLQHSCLPVPLPRQS